MLLAFSGKVKFVSPAWFSMVVATKSVGRVMLSVPFSVAIETLEASCATAAFMVAEVVNRLEYDCMEAMLIVPVEEWMYAMPETVPKLKVEFCA